MYKESVVLVLPFVDVTLVPPDRCAFYLFDENQRHERKMGIMNHNLYFGQWAVALLEVSEGVPQVHTAILQPHLSPIFPSAGKLLRRWEATVAEIQDEFNYLDLLQS